MKLSHDFDYVYGLRDPLADSIFYVGLSNDPSLRFKTHINSARNIELPARIRTILLAGQTPALQILDTCTRGGAARRSEMRWIHELLPQLVNRRLFDPTRVGALR
jgi:hypothetical protein